MSFNHLFDKNSLVYLHNKISNYFSLDEIKISKEIANDKCSIKELTFNFNKKCIQGAFSLKTKKPIIADDYNIYNSLDSDITRINKHDSGSYYRNKYYNDVRCEIELENYHRDFKLKCSCLGDTINNNNNNSEASININSEKDEYCIHNLALLIFLLGDNNYIETPKFESSTAYNLPDLKYYSSKNPTKKRRTSIKKGEKISNKFSFNNFNQIRHEYNLDSENESFASSGINNHRSKTNIISNNNDKDNNYKDNKFLSINNNLISKNIKSIFLSQNLINKVDKEVFKRGLIYFRHKKVRLLDFLATNKVLATVFGSNNFKYDVLITLQSDIILNECNCKFFHLNKSICKHIVSACLECDKTNKFIDPIGNTIDEEIRNQYAYREFNNTKHTAKVKKEKKKASFANKHSFDNNNNIKTEKNYNNIYNERINNYDTEENLSINKNNRSTPSRRKKKNIHFHFRDLNDNLRNRSSSNSSNFSTKSKDTNASSHTLKSIDFVNIRDTLFKKISTASSTFSRLDSLTYNSVKSSLDKLKKLSYSLGFDSVYSARKVISILSNTIKIILSKIKKNFRDVDENKKIFTTLVKFSLLDITLIVEDEFNFVEKEVIPLLVQGFNMFKSKLNTTDFNYLKNDIYEKTNREILLMLEKKSSEE